MKTLAKLILCFSLLFVFLFFGALLLEYLSAWIQMLRVVPSGTEPGRNAASLAWKALPITIYLSVLFTLSYTARKKIAIPLAFIFVLVLGCVFTAGISIAISRTDALNFALKPVATLKGKPGLLLSRQDYSVVLLKGSGDIRGPRVVSMPGQSLLYQEVPSGPNNTVPSLPPLPFPDSTPWFIRSLHIDFSLSAGEMESRLEQGLLPFGMYIASLILLLSSFRFLLESSRWPLANLFLGALVFRFILSLETLLNTVEVNTLLGSFAAGRLHPMAITPLVFAALAALIIIYTFLTWLAGALKPVPGEDEDD